MYHSVWFLIVTMSTGSQQQYFGLAVCNNYGSHEIHSWFAARSRHEPGVQLSMIWQPSARASAFVVDAKVISADDARALTIEL